jgi:hypothetical protein
MFLVYTFFWSKKKRVEKVIFWHFFLEIDFVPVIEGFLVKNRHFSDFFCRKKKNRKVVSK